jgi:hypothetical protein
MAPLFYARNTLVGQAPDLSSEVRGQVAARYVRTGLARYRLFQVSAQILEDLLLALLDFEQDRLRHSSVVLPRMDLARLEEDSPQIADALLREQHLFVGLNHGSSSSTIPRFRKLLEV